MQRASIFFMVVSIVLTACTPTRSMTGVSTDIPTHSSIAFSTEIPSPTPDLKTAIDAGLKNATYLIDGQSITLVNGVEETELAPGSVSKQVTRFLGHELEIDLNLDGLMDFAFFLQQESGGSGTFYFVSAAIKTADGYQGTNAVFLGDRIAPQSIHLDTNNPSQFIVTYKDRGTNEPMSSSPTIVVSRTFKFENDSLVEIVPSPSTNP